MACFFLGYRVLSDLTLSQLILILMKKIYHKPDYNDLGTNFEFKKENLAWALPCFLFWFFE